MGVQACLHPHAAIRRATDREQHCCELALPAADSLTGTAVCQAAVFGGEWPLPGETGKSYNEMYRAKEQEES